MADCKHARIYQCQYYVRSVFMWAYLWKCAIHTVSRKRYEVSYGCYTSFTLR